MKPLTLKQLWEEYRRQCYPGAIPPSQLAEVKQAFHAGAYAALADPDQIKPRFREAEAECQRRAKELAGNLN